MTDKRPHQDDAVNPGLNSNAESVVLRDVVVQGQVALTRPGNRHASSQYAQGRLHGPNLTPIQSGRKAEAKAAEAISEPRFEPLVAVHAKEEAHRLGYEDGFAKGSAEGLERAAQEARQTAAQAEQKTARELDERAERLTRELQQKAQSVYRARLETLEGLIASLPSQIEARLAAVEDDMLALSFEAVCRMLGERAVQPEAVRAQLTHAMSGLRGRRLLAVHLHPDDLADLMEEPNSLASGHWGGGDVQWIASTDIALGGCILQSPEGGLDARLETQLRALRDLLMQSRAANRSGGA